MQTLQTALHPALHLRPNSISRRALMRFVLDHPETAPTILAALPNALRSMILGDDECSLDAPV